MFGRSWLKCSMLIYPEHFLKWSDLWLPGIFQGMHGRDGGKERAQAYFRLFVLSPAWFITGFRTVGGDYAITDALLFSTCHRNHSFITAIGPMWYCIEYSCLGTSGINIVQRFSLLYSKIRSSMKGHLWQDIDIRDTGCITEELSSPSNGRKRVNRCAVQLNNIFA